MDATLDVVKREGRGKNEARRLRAAGRIPAVVYGQRKEGKLPEGVPVAVDPKAVLRILHSESGANTLITLTLDGTESQVMVKEYQLDPGHPPAAARRLLSARDGPRDHRDGADPHQRRAEGRQAAGRHARLRDARGRRCSACRPTSPSTSTSTSPS